MGPSKLKKAEDLGLKMISEQEFLSMIYYNSDESSAEGAVQGSLF